MVPEIEPFVRLNLLYFHMWKKSHVLDQNGGEKLNGWMYILRLPAPLSETIFSVSSHVRPFTHKENPMWGPETNPNWVKLTIYWAEFETSHCHGWSPFQFLICLYIFGNKLISWSSASGRLFFIECCLRVHIIYQLSIKLDCPIGNYNGAQWTIQLICLLRRG